VREGPKPIWESLHLIAQKAVPDANQLSHRNKQSDNSLSKQEPAKKLTTPYPHKYKTVLCRFWVKGQKCPFAEECNYAHGENQLVDHSAEIKEMPKNGSNRESVLTPHEPELSKQLVVKDDHKPTANDKPLAVKQEV
jgi:hypothetical protein